VVKDLRGAFEMGKTSVTRKRGEGRAIRVIISEDLEEKVAAEARRRGLELNLAVQVLLRERVNEIDDFDQLTDAEQWQRTEAWSTWQSIANGDVAEVPKSEIDAEFDQALQLKRSTR
jgi:hypothetical protein